MSARESDLLRLQAIVDCIDDVRETIGAFDFGIDNYVTPDGILDNTCRRSTDMLMLQLCEEAREATNETRCGAKGIPWTSIAEARNCLVHSYGSVDAAAVWGIIENDLTELRDACVSCIAEIEDGTYASQFGSRTKGRKATEHRSGQGH